MRPIYVILIVVCLFGMLAGCTRIVKLDAAHDKHVRATYKELVRHYELCRVGDVSECRVCLGMGDAELNYLEIGLYDPNKSVTMSKDFKDKFEIVAAIVSAKDVSCAAGDDKACRDGARHAVNEIGVVIAAVDDVNTAKRFKD